MTITQPQAQALAALLHELRPEWVIQSLMTLLWEHRDAHPFSELCTAAIAVANDSSKKTPAIIWMDGPHWHPTAPQTAPRQQFLTAAEKSRLQTAQRAGYHWVKNGIDPFDTTAPFYQPLINADDLNLTSIKEAFQRGQDFARWELGQQPPTQNAIETLHPNTLEEANP